MAINNNITLTPKAGSPVSLHGGSGVINLSRQVGDRFRRPVSTAAGYQRLGKDCISSTITYWHACADAATAKTLIDALNALCYQVVTLNYKEYTALRCVVTDHQVSMSKATRGTIITGSTPTAWRVEGTITLEHAP